MNTNTKSFLKLKNQKNEDVYKIENINENMLVSPLNPIINIFDKLTLHYGENDECVGELNLSEIFMSAISEAIENRLGDDSALKNEIDKILKSNSTIWFSEIADCFPNLEVVNDEYEQPDIQQILNDPFAKRHNNPMRRTEPKVGRNDPCPCGSGKKYKQCCLMK